MLLRDSRDSTAVKRMEDATCPNSCEVQSDRVYCGPKTKLALEPKHVKIGVWQVVGRSDAQSCSALRARDVADPQQSGHFTDIQADKYISNIATKSNKWRCRKRGAVKEKREAQQLHQERTIAAKGSVVEIIRHVPDHTQKPKQSTT